MQSAKPCLANLLDTKVYTLFPLFLFIFLLSTSLPLPPTPTFPSFTPIIFRGSMRSASRSRVNHVLICWTPGVLSLILPPTTLPTRSRMLILNRSSRHCYATWTTSRTPSKFFPSPFFLLPRVGTSYLRIHRKNSTCSSQHCATTWTIRASRMPFRSFPSPSPSFFPLPLMDT
jgi:hypothetical protein